MSKLGMCPFCGVDLKSGGKNFYVHPAVGCLLDEMLLINDKEPIKRWNNRKPLERIVERLEEAESYSCSPQFSKAIERAIEIVKEEGGMNER